MQILNVAIPHFFIHLSADEHLGCFHILATYKVVKNVYVQVSEWTLSEITEFNLLRNKLT